MKIKDKKKLFKIIFRIIVFISIAGNLTFYFFAKDKTKNVDRKFADKIQQVHGNIEKDGGKFVFKDGKPVYWSDNTTSLTDKEEKLLSGIWKEKIVVELGNGFFVHKTVKTGNLNTHYLYLIKNKYPYENRYLKNSFNSPFDFDNQVEITDYKTDYPVVFEGKTICYLDISPECLQISQKDKFIIYFWLILNLFLLCTVIISFTDKKFMPVKNKILSCCIILICLFGYSFLVYSLAKTTNSISLRFFSNTTDYHNILLFEIICLSGFLFYLIIKKTATIFDNNKWILVKEFLTLLLIAFLSGAILTLFAKPKTITQENTLIKEDDYLIFETLMSNAAEDSVVLDKIHKKDYDYAEDYIKQYYLSLLAENNHVNLLVFSLQDSFIAYPEKKYVNIHSYIDQRLKNCISEQSNPRLYREHQLSENDNYIYYDSIYGAYIFAECLKKISNKNMNYSLFLEEYFKPSDNNFNSNNPLWYNWLSQSGLLFFLFCFLLGAEHFLKSLTDFKKKTLSIKSKILFSLLISFLVSSFILAFFSIRSTMSISQTVNTDILKEKTETIAVELGKILDNSGEITENDLINLSNTFLVDINLFSDEGILKESSRKDIFDKKILSYRLHPKAFETIKACNDTLFYGKETICNGNFLASYLMITTPSENNSLILNIPFINQQQVMAENINNLINNFANMFLFWMNTAVIIFVFLSNIITKPINLIKQRLTEININKSNEKIIWTRDDEMGDLINSYNQMVDKIEQSTLLLKKQQRESSWRELAKQVAHDIKNPLTPMKLSIQYLQKIYEEKPSEFDNKFKQTAHSLITQIESISNIAQELNFYSKPSVKKEKTDLDVCIYSAISMFDSQDNLQINYKRTENCFVAGEQGLFVRIFNNLIKNAVQSLYNQPDGRIDIHIKDKEDCYIVSIEDNGCGIKKENQPKIFDEGFTTKTDGGGIGLAIVKSILESYDAIISFKSKENVGTVFFIQFKKLH